MSKQDNSGKKGFTLIELLIVIGIIGFLAAAILVAVDPVKRIQDARNAKRWSEVNGILNAILNKQVDDRALFNGTTPVLRSATTAAQVIVTTSAGLANCTSAPPTCAAVTTLNVSSSDSCFVNLSSLAPSYIAQLPIDPGSGYSSTDTGYYMVRGTEGRIEIGACNPDTNGSDPNIRISVKR